MKKAVRNTLMRFLFAGLAGLFVFACSDKKSPEETVEPDPKIEAESKLAGTDVKIWTYSSAELDDVLYEGQSYYELIKDNEKVVEQLNTESEVLLGNRKYKLYKGGNAEVTDIKDQLIDEGVWSVNAQATSLTIDLNKTDDLVFEINTLTGETFKGIYSFTYLYDINNDNADEQVTVKVLFTFDEMK